ncbi:SGNH/GDSL hydrolase family protein [Sphingomonas paeninsulae]
MLASKTGQQIIVGDSINVGEGSGASGPGAFGLGNAANFRSAKAMADIYVAAGIPAFDKNYITGDFGVRAAGGNTILTYDTRVTSLGNGDMNVRDNGAAGAAYLHLGSTAATVTDTGIDGFVIDVAEYDSAPVITFKIDGAAPAFMSINGVTQPGGTMSYATNASATGPSRIIVRTSSVGSHTLQMTSSDYKHGIAVVYGINSTTSQINILTFAACGQRTTDQTGTTTIALPAMLKKETPGLVVLTSATNDMIQGAAKATWLAAVASLVATAQAAGASVLLEFPYAFSNVADATVSDWNASLKAYGVANNLSVLSHYDFYGPYSGMAPSLFWNAASGDTHPTAAFSAALAQRRVDAIRSM